MLEPNNDGKRVLVLGDLPEVAIARLGNHLQVEVRTDGPIDQKDLRDMVPGVQGLLTPLTQKVDESVFASADSLQIVANYAVGVDNIDLEAARLRGIRVTNTPDVLTADTADLTWSLILGVVRSLQPASRFLREGRFTGWLPKLYFGRSLGSLTLGGIGAGRIGCAVLERAAGFGLRRQYTSRTRLENAREQELGVRWCSLAELLGSSDIVSLHAPLNRQTHHLIDESALRSMPKGGFLINTARGALVDESALVRVLRDGHLAGVGLDVFEREPDVEAGLLEFENAILVPHIGSGTPETRLAMADCCVDDLIEYLALGNEPEHRVI